VLEQASRWKWIDERTLPATSRIQSRSAPAPDAASAAGIESTAKAMSVAMIVVADLDPRFATIPIFATGTGLRPEEWLALERRDVDRKAGVVRVERVYTQGRLKHQTVGALACVAMDGWKFLQIPRSPLTDSNRRPPPYHSGSGEGSAGPSGSSRPRKSRKLKGSDGET